jgi:hypothetical protein
VHYNSFKKKEDVSKEEFQQKYYRLKQSKRKFSRNKVKEVISKSRENYQKSKNSYIIYVVNRVIKMLCEFDGSSDDPCIHDFGTA